MTCTLSLNLLCRVYNDEMGCKCSMHGSNDTHTTSYFKTSSEQVLAGPRYRWKTFEKQGVEVQTGFNWLRIWSSGL